LLGGSQREGTGGQVVQQQLRQWVGWGLATVSSDGFERARDQLVDEGRKAT
jgi:hypothetical protein